MGNDLFLIRYGDLELPRNAMTRLVVALEDMGEERLARKLDRAVEMREELVLAPVDLRPLASRVLARERRGHDRVAARLVGLDEPLVVQADEALLERALENLVRNALEAASDGGGHVELRVERSEGMVSIHVEDDGEGFAADHPGEVRPFYTTRPGGLGLGLPLARKMVVLHGGELLLAPRSPRGARVTVRIPEAPFEGSP